MAVRNDQMTISEKELAALHNLADKQAGKEVNWINIADARALTELGLARRNRGGWEITQEGLTVVRGQSGVATLVVQNDPPRQGPGSE
jgi:hypothetical protein